MNFWEVSDMKNTLKYGIELSSDWKVIVDNFRIKNKGRDLTFRKIENLIEDMRKPEFWSNPVTRETILKSLQEYRLSKFQQALPVDCSAEIVGKFFAGYGGCDRFFGKYQKKEGTRKC